MCIESEWEKSLLDSKRLQPGNLVFRIQFWTKRLLEIVLEKYMGKISFLKVTDSNSSYNYVKTLLELTFSGNIWFRHVSSLQGYFKLAVSQLDVANFSLRMEGTC